MIHDGLYGRSHLGSPLSSGHVGHLLLLSRDGNDQRRQWWCVDKESEGCFSFGLLKVRFGERN